MSFVFWYKLCEEYGPDLPVIFLQKLQREEERSADAAVRLIEEITGRRDIIGKLKKADVNDAIEVLQFLSRKVK